MMSRASPSRPRRITPFGWIFIGLVVAVVIVLAIIIRPAPDGERRSIAPEPVPSGALVIPVAGVQPAQLVDSFGDARADGARGQGALDIMAPRGTPVVAAAAGTVEKLFESAAGGRTLYLRTADRRWIHYYAHLDSYAPGVVEGARVDQGQQVARVGVSGNANPAGPHLHFEVKRVTPAQRWFEGVAVNPYPLLAGKAASG